MVSNKTYLCSALCKDCVVSKGKVSPIQLVNVVSLHKTMQGRRDCVAQSINWELCGMNGFKKENKWYEFIMQSVIEMGRQKFSGILN